MGSSSGNRNSNSAHRWEPKVPDLAGWRDFSCWIRDLTVEEFHWAKVGCEGGKNRKAKTKNRTLDFFIFYSQLSFTTNSALLPFHSSLIQQRDEMAVSFPQFAEDLKAKQSPAKTFGSSWDSYWRGRFWATQQEKIADLWLLRGYLGSAAWVSCCCCCFFSTSFAITQQLPFTECSGIFCVIFMQDKKEPSALCEGAEEGGKEGRRRRRPPCWSPIQCPTPLMRRRSARSKRLNMAAQKWSSWKLVAPEAPMWMNSVEENGEVEKWKWKGKKKRKKDNMEKSTKNVRWS